VRPASEYVLAHIDGKSQHVDLLQGIYCGFQVAARLMLGTCRKRLSCRVVLVGALAPLQAQAQLFTSARLLRELGLDGVEQPPRFLQDAVPGGVVASCNERLQLTDASRRQLR